VNPGTKPDRQLVCEGKCPKGSVTLAATTLTYKGAQDARPVPHDLLAKVVALAVRPHYFKATRAVTEPDRFATNGTRRERVIRREDIYECSGCSTERVFGVSY